MGILPPPSISENIRIYHNPSKNEFKIIIALCILFVGFIALVLYTDFQEEKKAIITNETGILTGIQFQNTPIGGIFGGIRHETILEINQSQKICICGTRNDLIIGNPVTITYKTIYNRKRIKEISQ